MKARGITDANGFRAMAALRKAAADPRIQEIEGSGCDEGTVFLHTAPGYWFRAPYRQHSYTVDCAAELRYVLSLIEPEPADAHDPAYPKA